MDDVLHSHHYGSIFGNQDHEQLVRQGSAGKQACSPVHGQLSPADGPLPIAPFVMPEADALQQDPMLEMAWQHANGESMPTGELHLQTMLNSDITPTYSLHDVEGLDNIGAQTIIHLEMKINFPNALGHLREAREMFPEDDLLQQGDFQVLKALRRSPPVRPVLKEKKENKGFFEKLFSTKKKEITEKNEEFKEGKRKESTEIILESEPSEAIMQDPEEVCPEQEKEPYPLPEESEEPEEPANECVDDRDGADEAEDKPAMPEKPEKPKKGSKSFFSFSFFGSKKKGSGKKSKEKTSKKKKEKESKTDKGKEKKDEDSVDKDEEPVNHDDEGSNAEDDTNTEKKGKKRMSESSEAQGLNDDTEGELA